MAWWLERQALRVRRTLRDALLGPRTVYVGQRVEEYRRYWKAAAELLHAEFVELGRGMWEVDKDDRRTRIINFITEADDPVLLRLAGNKPYCYELAMAARLPVPDHLVFARDQLSAARDFMRTRPGPFVVKPASGTASSLGITLNVRRPRDLKRGALLASLYANEFLIERMVAAESCRLLFLGGRMIHAVRRRGVRVVGDGRASIGMLLRRQGLRRLVRDWNTTLTLAAQQLSVGRIPAPGQEVVVRALPAEHTARQELRTVYTEDITALVGDRLRTAAAALVRELGSEFAGVDVLTNDPTRDLAEVSGVFLEVNTTPGIHHHYVPRQGDGKSSLPPIALPVLKYLLEHGAPRR